MEEIRRKIAESERDAKMLKQDNTAKEMKLEEFLNMEKFDTEKLREIIKVIRVHSQEEIEIEWNFDDVFLGMIAREANLTLLTYPGNTLYFFNQAFNPSVY